MLRMMRLASTNGLGAEVCEGRERGRILDMRGRELQSGKDYSPYLEATEGGVGKA